jgi:glycolate oxidase iron-sulfur subunit
MRRRASSCASISAAACSNLARASGICALAAWHRWKRWRPRSRRASSCRAATLAARRRKTEGDGVLHAGCVMHVAFAEVDEATVRVLQRAGCDVVAPPRRAAAARSRFTPAKWSAGARSQAKHRGVRRIGRRRRTWSTRPAADRRSRSTAPLCRGSGVGRARGRVLGEGSKDVTEFLDEIGIAPELGALDAVVTYQEPCHLAHAQRISAAPRRLLARIPGPHSARDEESSLCCGSAGIYNLTQPEMAERLGSQDRNILAAEPQIVATANPGCALQCRERLARSRPSDRRQARRRIAGRLVP